MKRKYFFLFLVIIFSASAGPAQGKKRPRNVIFMIGDGMGLAQITLARTQKGSVLHMDSMSFSGLISTAPADSPLTDSAAAGTALATGYKTANGRIGVLPDGKSAPSILEEAIRLGKATGLVTTVTITHGTPASFGAHQASRSNQDEIAPQYLQKKIDVLMGGGSSFFLPKSAADSKRSDERDLIAEAKALGYTYVESRQSMLEVKKGKLLGLFEADALSTLPPEPTLAEMTQKALELLDADTDGFFLMVEGGQIDYLCHDHDAPGAVKQILDFDAAVDYALQFARKKSETLVLVTADHETGGLALVIPETGEQDKLVAAWATEEHSATDVALFAEGPGAEGFTGAMSNTDVPKKIARLWKIADFAPLR